MAKILLDSDVLIEWLRGRQPVPSKIQSLFEQHAELFWTPVSVAEIFAGVRKGEEHDVEKLFVLLEGVPLTSEIGRRAGAYLKAFHKSHGLQLGDALIAASATTEGLLLWTLNKRHYPMKDLTLVP